MDVSVRPGRIRGRVRVPGSKSIAQRALILATHKGGTVHNVPPGDDVDRLCHGLRALGFDIEATGPDGATRVVSGTFHDAPAHIDAGENGTGGRFLTALAALRPAATTIDGAPGLRRRPIGPLCTALRTLGAQVEGDSFPVTVTGPLKPTYVKVSTEESSQFASALILLVDRARGLRIQVVGRRSFSYVGLTAHVQRHFTSPFTVGPDYSSAASLAAAAATTNGDLLLEGLRLCSPQPDARVFPLLNRAGAQVTQEDDGVRVRGGPLRGIRADIANCPDLAPLLAGLGVLAVGETAVSGAPHLRLKESDRIASSVGLVTALGGRAEPRPDGFVVRGGGPLQGNVVSAVGDHRIAMAAAVAGLSVPGVTVTGAEAVRKSYPRFFDDLEALTEDEL